MRYILYEHADPHICTNFAYDHIVTIGYADMDGYLNDKKKATEILIARATTIHEEFQFILGTSRLDITLTFKKILEEIGLATSKLNSIEQTDPWTLANHIGTIDDGFAKLAEIISNFDPAEIKSGASYTFILTTKSDMDSFLQYRRLEMTNSVNGHIYSLLGEKISSGDPHAMESAYLKNPHSSALFALYLQNALNKLPEKEQLPYLTVLERTKTRALESGVHESKSVKITWPLQRFGLIPAKQHMTPQELSKFYFESTISGGHKTGVSGGGGAKTSLETFISAAKLKKVNVLVMSAITASPIEYNISTLVEPTPGVDATAGISRAILDKFNTVHKYISYGSDEQIIPPKHIGFSTTEHKFAHLSGQYIIVRTLDGAYWDAMKNSFGQIHMNAFLIEKILRGPSPRVDAYQVIKAAEFAKFIMPAPEMGETIKKANKGLIQDLVNRITGRILQYVDTSLVPLPTDPKDLETAISDPRFVEIMTEEFLKSYKECGIDTSRAQSTPADELIGTFIADLETTISIQFARNIKLNMIELGPNATVFRDYHGETLRTRLYNLFVDVIKRSVSSSIMTKENIYEKILIKDHLLGVLAHQLSKAEQS